MARFVIANRRTGLHLEEEQVRSRMAVATTLHDLSSANVVQDHEPTDPTARRVVLVEADPNEVQTKLAALPSDVIVEPEIIHQPMVFPPPDLRGAQPAPALPMNAAALTLDVDVTGGGAPLANAEVILHTRSFGGVSEQKRHTDGNGRARFPLAPGHTLAAAVIVPEHGFWTMVVRGDAIRRPIECPPLPADGPLGWWHQLLGQGAYDARAGANVRVAVIDSGLGANAALAHATALGSFIDGNVTAGAAATIGGDPHGTHVAGTIGGRPVTNGGYAGIAPGATLLAARVFAPGRGANQGDIANAIDAASRENRADLINMSLGAPSPSEILHDAILDAHERGTLCLAAAGNEAGPVGWPAAFPEVVAVGALGLEGWGPAGSLSSIRLPNDPKLFGNDGLYVANFSCFGAEVDCAGPGVGVIAAMPGASLASETYGGMDGTSMATPAVCGALAVLLSRDNGYLAMPRAAMRAAAARGILNASLRDLALPQSHQGRGMPQL